MGIIKLSTASSKKHTNKSSKSAFKNHFRFSQK